MKDIILNNPRGYFLYNLNMSLIDNVKENNPVAFTIIKNAVESNKVAHAYLFSAPKNTLIGDVPLLLAECLINEDPFNNKELQSIETYSDVRIIDGSDGLIKKDLIVKAAEVLQQTTLDKRGIKILIIKNVENGNKQSLNSLLKFIEEPTPNTFIIMTTNNVSQVISTIRSRAQVVNLRAISFEKLVSDIEKENIDEKYVRVLASISKNKEDALNIFEGNFKEQFKNIVTAFESAKSNHDKIITSLSSIITKSEVNIVMPILRTFINDIWKHQQKLPISFSEESNLVESYVLNDFNFQEALIIINDFIMALDSNVNFELYKTQMLIRLRRCYG